MSIAVTITKVKIGQYWALLEGYLLNGYLNNGYLIT